MTIRNTICKLLCFTAFLLCVGCRENEVNQMAQAIDIEKDTITSIAFDYQSGMLYGVDYLFRVKEEQITYARFFDDGEQIEGEMIALSSEQWDEIQSLTRQIIKYTKPTQTKKINFSEFALDAGSESFEVAWTDAEGNIIEQIYMFPWTDQFQTLIAYLSEVVHPINRTITYYDEPVMNGIELYQKGNFIGSGFYQILIRTYDEGRTFKLSYESQNGFSKESKSVSLTSEQWAQILSQIEQYELDSYIFQEDEKSYVTLYYGHGQRKTILCDAQTMGQLKEIIESFMS